MLLLLQDHMSVQQMKVEPVYWGKGECLFIYWRSGSLEDSGGKVCEQQVWFSEGWNLKAYFAFKVNTFPVANSIRLKKRADYGKTPALLILQDAAFVWVCCWGLLFVLLWNGSLWLCFLPLGILFGRRHTEQCVANLVHFFSLFLDCTEKEFHRLWCEV